jgi:diaminohydroxyphosphoribosylaminopyrimidine deaminase/5-amino-6-(5-phosphoribosylamino)uracil reductase
VLVEAGAVLNGELLAKSLIDELVIYMAPIVLGDKGRGLFSLPGMATMAEKKLFKWSDVRAIGSDLRFILTPVVT